MAVRRDTPRQVKGLAFLSVMWALNELRGQETVDAALSAMGGEVAAALRSGGILAAGWYPVTWYRDMWRGIRSATGCNLKFVKLIGRRAFERDLNAVHRILMRAVSPSTVVSVGTRLTSRYYSGIESEFEVGRGVARGRYKGAHGWDENMWAEIHGGLEVMLELSGAVDIRVRLTAGGGNDDGYAEFEGQWR